MKNYILPLTALFLAFAGCRSDDRTDPVPQVEGYNYYPVAVGDYSIYEVTEGLQLGDTSQAIYSLEDSVYYLKETVDSSFLDLQNEEFFRIFRHRRSSLNDSWEEDSVIVIKKTNARLERTESNQRLVKLVFPMTENKSWNLNMLNASPEVRVRYQNIDQPYSLTRTAGDTLFPNTLLVVSPPDSNGLEERNYYERYAKGAGLIETYYERINYDDELIGTGIIEMARYRTVKLLERGQR